MFKYYNANPLGRQVNDCTVRAISLAIGKSWDYTYRMLSEYAQNQCIMPDDVTYIDEFLSYNFNKVYANKRTDKMTVQDFVETHPYGTFLITMSGHITCCINGCIYDTFNPENRYIWNAYRVY